MVCDQRSVAVQRVNTEHHDLLHTAAAMHKKEYLNSTQQLSKPTTAHLCHAEWQLAGWAVQLKEVADTVRVQDAINDSLLNKPHGFPRLYFIDGTFPGELPEGVTCQDDLPGQKTFSRLCLCW